MKRIKLFSILVGSIIFASSTFAASTTQQRVNQCLGLIKKTCGSKTMDACLKNASKEVGKTSECITYLVDQNREKKINVKGLSKSIGSYISGAGVTDDQRKCFKLTQTICKDGEQVDECMRKRAGQFPSFCRQGNLRGLGSLNKSLKNDRKLRSCTDKLVATCELKFPEATEKPDMKVYKAAMAKYQICLRSQIGKQKACDDVSKPKDEAGATQLIQ